MSNVTLVVYFTDPRTPGGVEHYGEPVKGMSSFITARIEGILRNGLRVKDPSAGEEWAIPWHMIRGINILPQGKTSPRK